MLTPVATRPAATPHAGSWGLARPRTARRAPCGTQHAAGPGAQRSVASSRSSARRARQAWRSAVPRRRRIRQPVRGALSPLKTVATRHDGREQVTGLHLAGEALGLDGICDDTHPRTAVALEDSSVCVIPYSALKTLCSEAGSMQLRMHKLMSEQIVRETSQTMLLGSLNAEERVAAFLLDVSSRYLKRGYSPSEFNLRMTREDIGSYLGMTLETVSRTLSKFQKRGLIEMQGRHVQIVDFDGLHHV